MTTSGINHSRPPLKGVLIGASLGVLLALALLSVFGTEGFWLTSSEKRPLSALLEDERNTVRVFDDTSPSVVNIDPIGRGGERELANGSGSGTGSGFIWDTDGHIVTNYHVIKDVRAVVITTNGQRRSEAEVIGVDPSKDIAVLKLAEVEGELTPVELGDDTTLHVGQKVLAIGNPFGLDHTLSAGIVSALDRELDNQSGRTIEGVIQTDAAINPGNSGGPLLDSSGKVVGMNSGIVSVSGASAGVGFAVPVSTIKRVVPDLIAYGRVRKVQLGVRFLSDRVSRRAGLKGLVVGRVFPGSFAQKAGLEGIRRRGAGMTWVGDVVIAADGVTTINRNDLLNVLDRKSNGDSVKLTVMRGEEQLTIEVPLVLGR